VSSAILQTYYTQLVGDPTSMPTIKASAEMGKNGKSIVIESNVYTSNGASYQPTNVFFRQIRNLIIDTTSVPNMTWGIHWPSSQATSIQNVIFKMPQTPDSEHTGLYMEEGSGGFLADLVFYGGQLGVFFGNQQYTTRNLTFVNCQTAIFQVWDWLWVYKDIVIKDCGIGINVAGPMVGSAIIVDGLFYNVSTAVLSGRAVDIPGEYPGRGELVMENVLFEKVDKILQGPSGTLLEPQGDGGTLLRGMILVGVVVHGVEISAN
jgi:glucan 1,3-beta-glucosidase